MLVNFAQGIEDGFALLEAFDYGPYPVVDKVLTRTTFVITIWFCQSLGEDAFLPLPPREILNNGQVKASISSVPDASIGLNNRLQPR